MTIQGLHVDVDEDHSGSQPVHIVRLRGALDAHNFSQFQDQLEELVDTGCVRLVVAARELDFISSAGLGVLKATVMRIRDQGGDLRLAELSGKILNVMQLLGFCKIYQTFASCQDAVRSYEAA